MTPIQQGGTAPGDEELLRTIPRDKGVRHLRLGLFVIVGFISFFVILFLLTDPGTFRGRYDVFSRLTDAGGVRRGDPIQMRGIIIGRVSGFEMAGEGTVTIRLEVENEWQIPDDSRVRLADAGLFGGRTVAVLPGESGTFMQPGDTLPGEDQGGGLMSQAGDLAEEAGVLLDRLQVLLDSPTVNSVQNTSQEVLQLARDLRALIGEQADDLSRLTSSLNRTATGLEDAAGAGKDVASAAARADTLLAELTSTTQRMDAVMVSLDQVIGRMARGEGTLGKLSQDESLYENLDQAAFSLNELLVDLKANPRRYLTVEIF
jgi:phospholipid/cholesterol/gamma-HCH transport system substrate-binding protein